ncbi:type VI secretion system tip protein VgrG [Candidatus Cytomitobacter indipagum]|uniref:Type VI secretion system tip protein VgrG n=1 Tax=Candidatus Cytomitobacter indipagum TaxID=2601575 RepID=A0A5C0UF28_9PROT|nr:type VI secretion system tip protein TssI/VgrG [Candidatus Cytomitobacter indipagum]QEK38243.1 type VI secretion system tip protein VgrG [Candidatus Cytomitobacter indipagum]
MQNISGGKRKRGSDDDIQSTVVVEDNRRIVKVENKQEQVEPDSKKQKKADPYNIEWVATFNYDLTDKPEDYVGHVFVLNIQEGLSEAFCVNGSGSFKNKQENMVGKKVRLGLSIGIPGLDTKCWHGVVNKWEYLRDSSAKDVDGKKIHHYMYKFSIIPEIQFKLSTKRSRVFFPSGDDQSYSDNQDIKFNRAKLMNYVAEKLIKDNGVDLQDNPPNEKRKKSIYEEYDAIYSFYDYLVGNRENTDPENKVDRGLLEKLDEKNGISNNIAVQIKLVDAFGKLSKFDGKIPIKGADNSQKNAIEKEEEATKHKCPPKRPFFNYEDKTNFSQTDEEEFPEYIVQYDETDWEFLNRLCREFGVYYCFEHTDYHTGMVFYSNPQGGDSDNAFEDFGRFEEDEDDEDYESQENEESSAESKPYKTYLGYENAILGYKPDGSYDEEAIKVHKSKQKSLKSNETSNSSAGNSDSDVGNNENIQNKSDDKTIPHVTRGDENKVFDLSDPFTDSKPLYYSNANLKRADDQYISQWHEVNQFVQPAPQLYGYNPDYDPEKRNVLREQDQSEGGGSFSESESANSEKGSSRIQNYYNENFTSEKRVNDYNELYKQHAQSTETEYYAKTYRQEISPGYKFVLTHHPDLDMNGQYYVKRAVHNLSYEVVNNADPESADLDDMELRYENEAVFAKIDQPFKILPIPQRKILGIQTGIVVGGEDQKIYTNHMGHVKVYFHWDSARKDLSDGEKLQQAIWVRVAQWGGAGNEWGGFFVPRVGQEVIISFENGNPSKPIVMGCLYNRSTMPPYNLVETEEVTAKTGIKTESLKDVEEGEEKGFNELSFEDKANEEKVFLHAEKDYEQIIKDTRKSSIGSGSDELTISKGDRKVEILGEDDPTDGSGNDILIIKKGNKEIKLESEEAKNFLTELKNGDIINKIEEGNYKLDLQKGNQEIKLQDGDVEISIEKGDMKINMNQGDQKENITGNKDITIVNGNYTIKIVGGNMEIEASQISYQATDFSIKSAGNLSLEAGGNLSIKGGNIEMKSETTADIEASAMMNINAGIVNIN